MGSGFIPGRLAASDTVERLIAYVNAGADCLYAPGVTSMAEVEELAVAPKPVNVLLLSGMFSGMRVADLAAVGVRRVSIGGGLAAAAWGGFDRAVRQLLNEGTVPPRG